MTSRKSGRPNRKRQHLLQALESRQMLAGPQLIGIQPNEGDLIVNGSIQNIAPRALTFRFDEVQQIDPATLAGIQISRAGGDGQLGTADDVRIAPGLVTLGDIRQNEVVVRFNENLPDDRYQIELFSFDDPANGITALRNAGGEAFIPADPSTRSQTVRFELNLGALVEAIVPQPVVRLADGSLDQRRDEILVYFNEDELFVENDANGAPTLRSAEHPRFYQLFLTRDTVSTIDDAFFSPTRVIYDAPTHTARLIFANDLNVLAGPAGTGGTFRLRLGAAVNDRTELVFAPTRMSIAEAGDTLTTSADVGVFSSPTSLIVSGSISPKPFAIQLPGSTSDPGRLPIPDGVGGDLAQIINDRFGPDSTDGITEIAYNFQSSFAGGPGTSIPTQLNNITNVQKQRVREALDLWARYLGVQFRETADSGITFAVGNVNVLEDLADTQSQTFPQLNARVRIDSTFQNPAMVFSSQAAFSTGYGQDFFRKSMAGIGFLLGLEQATDLGSGSIMTLDSIFLNESINPAAFLAPSPSFLPGLTTRQQTINDAIDSQTIDNPIPNALRGAEPSFPGNYDILHGRLLYRLDGNDVDLYRLTVDLDSPNTTGELNVETFAERLPDSSLLDTTITLFREQAASALADFGVGSALSVRFDAVQSGAIGNNARVNFIQSSRAAGDTAIRVTRVTGADGQLVSNAIRVDIPLRNAAVSVVPISAVIDAINNDTFANTLFRASLAVGAATTNIIRGAGGYPPVVLGGGGLVQLSRNDDYFSKDSLLTAELSNGVYYVGVSASGNDTYDPTTAGSGYGGSTQGNYDLQITFSPRISEVDSIRDRDAARVGVPGTAIDGDGDGTPGGVKNFWFQTRPAERMVEIIGNGSTITARQTFTVTGANGQSSRFEFVPIGSTAAADNVAIAYNPGPGSPTPASSIADSIRSAINSQSSITGVRAERSANATQVLVLSGERSLQFSSNFTGATVHGRTIFVDKNGSVFADGTAERPFNTIANPAVPNAFAATFPNDIVRIVGNGGQDNNLSTAADNFAYQIGTLETGGGVLNDGRNMEVPKGVTVMIDAGAAFKLRNSTISVGSTNLQVDRSGGAIQILGTPRLVNLTNPSATSTGVALVLTSTGAPASGNVTFTSTRDRAVDSAASGNSPTATPGNWGGLIFRRDVDKAQGRRDLEDEGIFLQSVNHADIRFGGGSNILVDANQTTVNPIQLIDLRPTITFNRLQSNASAAISATPDSFEETSFQSPRFQQAGRFTPDYGRVGPDINNNLLTNNSINGLFIRTETVAGQPIRQLTVAGRFDDIDIVHYIAENIVIAGSPGGSIEDGVIPDFANVSTVARPGGSLAAGDYTYRMTFVDANGFESLASESSTPRTVTANQSIELVNLPAIREGLGYVSRRLYRLAPGQTDFVLAAELPPTGGVVVDTGRFSGARLDLTRTGVRGRLDASLVIDPGTVVKFRGARIELGQGTQLLAEGTPERPIIFTSSLDDRFGGGGSFDTNNDRNTPNGGTLPRRGDWSGLYASPNAHVSLDNAVVAYGGGVSLIEGGQSRGFLALELHQASARVANSRFEFNDYGLDGSGPVGRNGRLAITPATIYVRGSEPTIINNQFVDNYGSIIDIDLASMSAELNPDLGRQTGALDRFTSFDDNYGPLIRLNTTSSPAGDVEGRRQLNGLRIRGGQLATESIWDDTDIAHVLFDSVTVSNQVSGGALTLKSRADESLVIKLLGEGTPNSPTIGTGFTATGTASDMADRIGGTIHVLGLPGAPVVFTSYKDDSVGAGRRLDGTAQTDTNGDGIGSRPSPNDWRSLHFDGFSNDRNVGVVQEFELPNSVAPGLNGSFNNAQVLGDLAERLTASDDSLRLGFDVRGYLSEPTDIDTYSFSGVSGTVVWIDVDKTTFSLDTVIELLDPNGIVVARSDNSFDEFGNPSAIFSTLTSAVGPLANQGVYADTWDSGLYADFGSTNPRDAGLRVALPGAVGLRNNYFVRVRSSSANPADAAGGRTDGAYSFQVRLREEQEFPGSTVQFADIRFANHGIHLQSLPGSSPLLGEAQENESAAVGQTTTAFPGGSQFDTVRYATNVYANNDILNGGLDFPVPVTGVQNRPLNARPQYIGNIAESKLGAISVGGSLSAGSDVDFYQIDVRYDTVLGGLQRSTVFDIDYADGFDRPDTNLSIFYSPTGRSADARLVLFGQNSNILEDQASPLDTIDVGELLSRGSIRTGDAFVGPVSLPQGSYFVAVTESGRLPQELASNPLVRREPIDSLLRIFEDHIDSIDTNPVSAPREGSFVDTTTPGWSVTTDRAQDLGHQLTTSFNGSKLATAFPPSVQFETEFNDSFATADDVGGVLFSRAFDPNIGSATANTSVTIPHTTVRAQTAGDVVDVYRFTVATDGSTVILDVDNGFNPQSTTDFTSVDLKMQLFREVVDPVTGAVSRLLVASNSTAPTTSGALGSLGGLVAGAGGATTFTADPFIQTVLPAGVYFVAVSPEATFYDSITETFVLDVALAPVFGTYDLHLSIENAPFAGGDPNNQSYRFDRSEATGVLTSNSYDLTGYSAADVPRFYFDYFFSPAVGDTVTLTARSDQQATAVNLGLTFQLPGSGDIWRQGVVDLASFAGHTGIVMEFTYSTDPTNLIGEGLYLDNFVVGFAERGEMVTGADIGAGDFTPSFVGVPGQYQLEVRGGTQYTTQVQGGIELSQRFDTNDRHAQQVTLVAPEGALITNGDRFVLSDGNRRLTFEFNTTSNVAVGNIRIPYTAADSAQVVARKIIEAINSGTVQTLLDLKASTSSGAWNFTGAANLPTDARVALHGSASGEFEPVSELPAPSTPLARNADGTLRLAAIFDDGTGDSNALRTQGQVVVANNVISDVRAIGIWSDVGFRGTDPEDDRSPELFPNGRNHLRLPPVGNSQLGAALNLPTLNNSVAGGLATGVTIVNNIVDQAGFSGIKVDGETRPFVIEWNGNSFNYISGTTQLQSRGDILVPDGFMFAVDASGTRVVFEFEDVSGAPTAVGGSGVVGGDGFVDGHVPIYYRLGEGPTYNPSSPAPNRNFGYTAHELMMAVYEAIQGSSLVTNGLVELVRPTIGPSVTSPFGPRFVSIDTAPIPPSPGFTSTLDFANPAVYLEGVTGIYSSFAFQKAPFLAQLNIIGAFFDSTTGVTTVPPMPLAPVYESPQPLARIINNTIYGADGTEASYLSDGSLSRAIELPTTDSGETIETALDTKQGRAHRGAYIAQGTLGDNSSDLPANQDVDFYKVELSVGDRLIVDIDTLAGGPATTIRLFDSRGIEQASGTTDEVADYLKPGTSIQFPRAAVNNNRDQFLDFTAESTGTYFIGISSRGNETYDALSRSGRTAGTGGVGAYTLGIEVLAPRTFVFSIDTERLTPFGAEVTQGNDNGTDSFGGVNSPSIIGSTFTISQIPDYLIPTRAGDAYRNVDPDGNRVTFEFTDTVNAIVLPNGNINVPLLRGASSASIDTHRIPDIMRAIANAINGYLNNPALPNHENGNGPGGANGPVSRVKARALGGAQVDNAGIENLVRLEGFPRAISPGTGFEFTRGFGHDRRESGNVVNIVPDGTFTDSQGTTELFTLIENAAKIELSPAARAAGLKLGPDNSRLANGNPRLPQFSTESDQLLTEFGILISSGASAAILNNVVSNAHQSIVKDESSLFGFGGRIDTNNPDRNVKPSQVVVTGNAVQFDDERNTQIRSQLSWWVGAGINVINRNPVLDSSLSTDLRTGPSNVPGGNSDFNFVLRPEGTPGQSPGNFIVFTGSNLLENPAGNRFIPVQNAPIVDSAVDSILENTAFATLKASVGIPSGQIVAPARDNAGQLRADDPLSAPPGGLGSNVFKDRGALDRADFVGPVAILETPLDNDAAGIDSDPTTSFVQLRGGVYDEFRILLQDAGDSSDPFVGTGIDDNTVVVPVIPGLRASGAAITVFEGDRLLVEGVDYTYSYDTTKNTITLRPLAGIWRSDRAYRVALNNRDRIVGVAPAAGRVADGDTFVVVDASGGRVTFEYDSGYQLLAPEALQLTVPPSGVGSVADGDLFTITDSLSRTVTFQFKISGDSISGTRLIRFQPTESQATVAASIRAAIALAVTEGVIDVDVDTTATGPTVIIGSDAGSVLDVSRSGLIPASRTLGLRIPATVLDGEEFTIGDGTVIRSFEFDVNGNGVRPGNLPIAVQATATSAVIANAISTVLSATDLLVSPVSINSVLFLGLPANGFATVASGQLTPVGISRTPADGDTLTLTSDDGESVTLELSRDAAITAPNIIVPFTRLNTSDQLASAIANVLRTQSLANPGGFDGSEVQANPGGLVSIGGSEGLDLALNAASTLVVTGQPGVTGQTRLQISGPLLAQLPIIGGNGISDDSQFTLSDGLNTVTFLYNVSLTGVGNPLAIPITYQTFQDVDTIANATVAAINASALAITATNRGGGVISFGQIDAAQVVFPPLAAPLTLRRGVVPPGTTGPGPLLAQLPTVGGNGIQDDSQFTVSDGINTVVFAFNVNLTSVANPLAIPITYQTSQDADTIANAMVAAINASGLTITATNVGGGVVSFGDAVTTQVTFPPIAAPLSLSRGIVTPGEQIVISQGAVTRTFEFRPASGGGAVGQGIIAVVYPDNGTIDDVATVLAAAINNNAAGLDISAEAQPGGFVQLDDTPQTIVNISDAPTVTSTGTPGGRIAIEFNSSFSPEAMKRAIVDTINQATTDGNTTLVASNRGGGTFFVENAQLIEGVLPNYFLSGIKDLAGQLLKPNRADNTTQFTLLLPTIGLDYGDAPDPVGGVAGRYPTLLSSDGPRHIVSDQVILGRLVDIDSNGLPTAAANGDDTTIFVLGTSGTLFNPTVQDGFVEVAFTIPGNVSLADGATMTLSTGVDTVTFEFDTDGIFTETNFAVSVNTAQPVTAAVIGQALIDAIDESPLRPADAVVVGSTVQVITDDEDGVLFISDSNPFGTLNRGTPLPISVTVTGGGILEAWIDFNFDGDFNDPGEQIISAASHPIDAVFSANATGTPVTREFIINVPASTPAPNSPTATYARFRVSADGGLSPTGLALSGEVEDYRLMILPGLPPNVTPQNSQRQYVVDEDSILQASDADGTLTPGSTNDNGALQGITDPNPGDIVAVFADDVGPRTLLDGSGTLAGQLDLNDDGTFTFQPAPDFFGQTVFSFRVADVPLNDPLRQLVSPLPVTVTITINPVNDAPVATTPNPTITRNILEDEAQTFTRVELTAAYSPGPANEANQRLFIQSAGVNGVGFQTELGGILTLVGDNLQYTPPANFPGPGPDRFTYVVADDPNDPNQLIRSAAVQGTILINITSVNDAPNARPDSYTTEEDTPLTIQITGPNGILTNDDAGPPDEVAAGQTVSLVTTNTTVDGMNITGFPKQTLRGGMVTLSNGGTTLVYTPALDFNGQDQFEYFIRDSATPPAFGRGTVFINVGGDNDPPVFVGVNGDPAQQSITEDEAKQTERIVSYNLSSWFTDPEGDISTFEVTSTDPSIVQTEVIRDNATGVSTLRLTLQPFRFGELSLDIRATNIAGPFSTARVPVTIRNTPDAPIVIGTLDPLTVDEDQVIVRDLTTVFNDRDGDVLTYKVTRFGGLTNPTLAQIAASPLIESINFVGNNMTIRLDADASGEVEIEISATDSTGREVRDTFTLTVNPVADDPRGENDFYNVPIGARFEIIDPSQGVLANDVDPDEDVFAGTTRKVRVDLTSVTQTSRGTVVVNQDGTFVYTNTSGERDETDSFTYRPIDPTGRVGNVVTVTFNLGRSRYQNPIPGFETDVTANGAITPLDALRIINRLARARVGSIPVSELTTAPPDFLDVDGNGFVNATDALLVINEIARRNRLQLQGGEGEFFDSRLATTVAYAAPSNVGLTESNRQVPADDVHVNTSNAVAPYDPFAAGFEIMDRRVEESIIDIMQSTQSAESPENTSSAVDEALTGWFEPTNL